LTLAGWEPRSEAAIMPLRALTMDHNWMSCLLACFGGRNGPGPSFISKNRQRRWFGIAANDLPDFASQTFYKSRQWLEFSPEKV
jgi:hypothetical protein